MGRIVVTICQNIQMDQWENEVEGLQFVLYSRLKENVNKMTCCWYLSTVPKGILNVQCGWLP